MLIVKLMLSHYIVEFVVLIPTEKSDETLKVEPLNSNYMLII